MNKPKVETMNSFFIIIFAEIKIYNKIFLF